MAEKPKGGPKSKPASSTLYVKDPNDSRLKMYEDSVLATGRAIESNKFVDRLDKMPMDKRRIEVLKGYKPAAGSGAAIGRLEKANKQPYREGTGSNETTLTAPAGFGYNARKSGSRMVKEEPGVTNKNLDVKAFNVLTPKRKVELVKPPRPKPAPERKVSEPIEPMQPRAASTKLAKEEPEMVAPVARPVKEPAKETRGSMKPILRYPAMNMNVLEKIKAKITGKNPMPYWEDKDGVKRYPSRGENNAKDIQEKKMLKEGLNPNDANDKATLDRVDAYYNKSSKK